MLIVLALIGFIAYGYLLELLPNLFPPGQDLRSAIALLVLQGFLAALVVGGLMSYPIAWLTGRYAFWAALAVASPVLVFRGPALFDTTLHGITTVIVVYEIFAYVALLVVGAWLAHNSLSKRCQTPVPGS
ncbi:hypothetical protein SR882_07900 [Guyparkeria halophila]|uniref:DUF4345 domain-containing protein n=1 Tax=Guyparkeria halophila TaxID=47960 RepID=A0ABZ0YWV8_9GAMM|nr:hypothetical protein [Guyparkeria halophila]WQH15686.1 hypothetical protein SR882_07900 [Guyparkeria halophila]